MGKTFSSHILPHDYLSKKEAERLKRQSMKYSLAEKSSQSKKRYAELKELHLNKFIASIVEIEAKKNEIKRRFISSNHKI